MYCDMVPHQPTSISAHAFPTPSPSPPWDRGLNQYPFIAVTPPPLQSAAAPAPSSSATSTLLTPSPSPANMAQLVHSTPQMVIVPAGATPGMKDSKWLTLEVCREFQRSKCSRSDNECKFAHPPPHVEVQNGRVVACFDSIKGKCQRKEPLCKYLHPPQHLREQLLQNGRNNLILKNLQLQAYQQAQYISVMPVTGAKTVAVPTVVPGQYPYLAHPSSTQAPPQAVLRPPTLTPAVAVAPSPYDAAVNFAASQKTHYPSLQALSAAPAQAPAATYSPYLTSFAMPATADSMSMLSQQLPPNMISTKALRTDKYETSADNSDPVTTHASLVDSFSYPTYITQVCREFQRGMCSRATSECRFAHPTNQIVVNAIDNHVTVCMDFLKNKCMRDQCKYFHPPSHLQTLVRASYARSQASVSNITTNISALATSSTPVPHTMVIAKKRPRDPVDEYLLSTVPGLVPAYKRIAVGDISKGGFPMYQTNPLVSPLQPASYMPLQQHPSYIPVTYTYVYPSDATLAAPAASSTFARHHLSAAVNPTIVPSALPTSTITAASSVISDVTTTSSIDDSVMTSRSGLTMLMFSKSNHSNTVASTQGVASTPSIPNNAYYVEYFGNNKQLRDTLPVCQEFRSGLCSNSCCKFVHLSEDYVEINNNHITVCRDFATRKSCRRSRCKYYHIPIELPPS